MCGLGIEDWEELMWGCGGGSLPSQLQQTGSRGFPSKERGLQLLGDRMHGAGGEEPKVLMGFSLVSDNRE